jgi:hypothetical protein
VGILIPILRSPYGNREAEKITIWRIPVPKYYPCPFGDKHIYSDCLGVLERIKNLLPTRIPSSFTHPDILTNFFLVHCNDLSFNRIYSHVQAHHQDDSKA